MASSSAAAVVRRYRSLAARVLAFDAWIGNRDRHGNVKAVTAHPNANFFAAFDHSHSLLGCESDADLSLRSLESDENFVQGHPFAPYLQASEMQQAVRRLQLVHSSLIAEACVEELVDFVPYETQSRLGELLTQRRDRLAEILARFCQ